MNWNLWLQQWKDFSATPPPAANKLQESQRSVKEQHALSAWISSHQHSKHTQRLPHSTSASTGLQHIHSIRGRWSDNKT